MSEIKPVSCNEQPVSSYEPVYQSQTGGEWHDVTDKEYTFRRELSGVYKTRILYPAAAYEALQKENKRLKVDLYGMQEAKKAQFNISKANQEESRKLLNEAFDDNAMKQQTIISLKYEIDGMHDLNVTQAIRIAELEEKDEMLGDMLDLLKIDKENWFSLYSVVAELKSKNGDSK